MLAFRHVDAKAIGGNVKRTRREAGLSQEKLAKKLGVNVMTVSRLERGVVKDVSVQRLCEVAEAIGVPVSVLLECE